MFVIDGRGNEDDAPSRVWPRLRRQAKVLESRRGRRDALWAKGLEEGDDAPGEAGYMSSQPATRMVLRFEDNYPVGI